MTKEFYVVSTSFNIQERMTATKGKVFDIYFRVINKDGKELQKKLSGFKTKALAKTAHANFISEKCEVIKQEQKTALLNPSANNDLCVKDIVNQYFSSLHNQLKEATIYEKQKIFNLIILPSFGETKLRDLTTEKLYLWQDKLWSQPNPKTGKPYSYKYLCKIRAYFSAFLSWCSVRYTDINNNFAKVVKPKRRTPQTKMQFWTREEFNQFIAVVDNPMYYAFFSTLFYTGRRKGEVIALTPGDVDLQKQKITFNKSITRKTLNNSPYNITSTKTELVSSTPICASLLSVLQQFTAQQPFYFSGNQPLTDTTIRRVFNHYCEVAQVKQIRIHDLRHSFVSMCIHLGATLPVVADLIGDTLAQVTKTYAHMYESDKRKIIDLIG